MKKFMNRLVSCAAVAASLFAAQSASANTYTYEFTWSGRGFYDNQYGESDASASATVVVQADSLGGAGFDQVSTLSLSVTDASVGNGVFSKSDFNRFFVPFRSVPTLELNQRYELSSFYVYDIVFGANGTGAPSNFANFTMWAAGNYGGTALYLTSMYVTQTAADVLPVPEPESYAMLIAGLGLLGVAARKRNGRKIS
jgi:hypothetical protein